MQRSILFTLAAALSGPVMAAGTAALGDFSVANTGTLVGDPILPGTAPISAAEMLMTGGDAAVGCVGGVFSVETSPCALLVSLARAGDYSFSWAYNTTDGVGPGGDLFGVVVDGRLTVISDPGGPITQSGNLGFTATTSFGWFINCTDCSGGSASVLISNFSTTAVPEPVSLALWLAGLAGIGAARRRLTPAS